MSSFRKVFTSISLYSLSNLLPTIGRFVLMPIFSRALCPADYGVTASMVVLSNLMGIVFGLSMEKATFRYYHQAGDQEDRQTMLSTFFWTSVLSCIPLIALSMIMSPVLQFVYPSIPFYPFYFLTILNLIFLVMNKHIGAYYQISQQPIRAFIYNMSVFVLGTIISLVYIVVLKRGALGVISATLLGNALVTPFYIYMIVKRYPFRFDKKVLKKGLDYILPYLPVPLVIWIINLSNRVILEKFVSHDEIGLYNMADQIPQIYYMVVQALALTWIPTFFKLAKDQTDESRKLIEKNGFIYNLIALFFALMAGLFAFEFTWILLDSRYHEIYKISRIILFGQIFMGFIQLTTNQYFQQAEKIKLQSTIYAIASVVNVALNLLLIPWLSVYGSALATILGGFTLAIIQQQAVKKFFYIPVHFFKYTLFVLVMAGILCLFTFVIEEDKWLALGVKIGLLISLGILAYFKRNWLKQKLSALRV